MSKSAEAVGPAGRIAAVLFGALALFQAALAAGAPWGDAAYGGGHSGTLPADLRVSSAVSVLVYAALATIAGTTVVRAPWRRRILLLGAVLMLIGSVVNLASPSIVERLLWTPVCVVLVLTLWSEAGRARLDRLPA